MQRRLLRPAALLIMTLGVAATLFAFADYRSVVPLQQSTFDATESTLSAATTGCGLCQQTGLCDHAFKGNPGQFCLTLVSGLPCCCPQDAQCVVSNAYNCRCRRVSTHSTSTTTTTTTTASSIKPLQLFPLFAMLLCALCCLCAARNRNAPEAAYYPGSQSVYTTPQYGATQGSTQPEYQFGYPSAPPATPYDAAPAYDPYAPYAAPVKTASPHNHSSGNAFAAGAVGAVAGLATGMLAGSMFSGDWGVHNGPETATTTTTTTSYFGGDSGYEISGDTDGDGGDFGGDS